MARRARQTRATNRGTFNSWFSGGTTVSEAIMEDGVDPGDVFIIEDPDGTDPSTWPAGTVTYNGAQLDPGDLTSGWWDAGDWTIVPLTSTGPGNATGIGTSTGTTSLAMTGVSGSIIPGMIVTGTGAPANFTVIRQLPPITTPGGAGTYLMSATSTLAGISLTFQAPSSLGFFPDFTPIIPPPLIGNPPPPAGTQNIPVVNGAVVGPAIAPAAAPPSTPGFTQPRFQAPGSATVPTGAQLLPQFTTTFPNPPITVSNVWTIPTISGGVWTTHLPAPIATTANITLSSTWGPPGPSGAGPGPPAYTNPPGAGKPAMASVEGVVAAEALAEEEPEEHHRRGRRR